MSDLTSHSRDLDEGTTHAASVATAVILSLIVVGASFTLSFNALADLAKMSGAIPDSLSPLLPVVIDVFILQATWCVYVATRRRDDVGKRYHFTMLAVFSTVSVAGNAGHAFLATGDHGLTHGLMAVAIAMVAPLALLASIHGLVMHVWAGGRVAVPSRTDHAHAPVENRPASSDCAQTDTSVGAPHAQSQVNPALTPTAGASDQSHTHAGELEVDVTDDDLQLARLVRSRGRVQSDESTVARVLVRERNGAPREETARIIGVHRTTISRWIDIADECRSAYPAHAQSLVDAG
ncbi:DUF2637 domain-containing protein [Gordonia aquimaris]|uniref:DUF2637 domain-containing protein n=1 Tax=Gordonia aquimaris TaxID=2984863 RepID=A0A9X3D925_9ACTN|nr:DUF2637 domain-containing protein [Gordonia aquimaris]MCX2966274.1 DUF2637 domain-containing protein [Gordonia aquimaris]